MTGVFIVDAPSNSGVIIDPCTAVHRHGFAPCTNDSSCDSKDMCHPLFFAAEYPDSPHATATADIHFVVGALVLFFNAPDPLPRVVTLFVED